MSGKNSNWLSDIKQCIHYKEPGLDCTLVTISENLSDIYQNNYFQVDNIWFMKLVVKEWS